MAVVVVVFSIVVNYDYIGAEIVTIPEEEEREVRRDDNSRDIINTVP